MKISHDDLLKIIYEEISLSLNEQDIDEALFGFGAKKDISHFKHTPTKETNIPSFKNMVADLQKYKSAKDRQSFLLNIITMIIKPELYTLSEAGNDKNLTNQLKSIGDQLTKTHDSLSKINFGNLQIAAYLKRTAAMSDNPKQNEKPDPEADKPAAAMSAPEVKASADKPAARRYGGYTLDPNLKGKQAFAITPGEATPEEKAKARKVAESTHKSNKISVKIKG